MRVGSEQVEGAPVLLDPDGKEHCVLESLTSSPTTGLTSLPISGRSGSPSRRRRRIDIRSGYSRVGSIVAAANYAKPG
jgi:hypothetical protein